MKPIRQILAFVLCSCLLGIAAAAEPDTLHTALEDSKASNRGLTFYVNGQAIPGVVVSVGDKYVVARSTAQGTIVIRLDRIDAVAGFVGLPQERKAQ